MLVVLVPVALQGGLGDLVDMGFRNKETYLRIASISYLDTLHAAYGDLRLGRPFESPLAWLWDTSAVLLPVVATVALVLGLALGRHDRRGLVVAGAYGAAAFAGAYPRMDYVHLAAAAPCLVVVVAGSWAQLPRSVGRRADGLAFALTTAVVGAFLLATIRAGGHLTVSSLPHLEGVRVQPEVEAIGRQWQAGLAPASMVFVVRQDAGFAYLVSGAANPTRFDYPATSSLGSQELGEIRVGIADGKIANACIGGPPGFLEPIAVDILVERTMHPVRSTDRCDLYRTTSPR